MFKKIFSTAWQGWKKFAHRLGRINTFILLTVFYFFIFGLIAIIRKCAKLFRRKIVLESYWISKDKEKQGSFEQQF